MGKTSREKWLRRLELACASGDPRDKSVETRKWHVSWLVPCATTVVVGWIAAGSGIEMIPLMVVIWLGFVISFLSLLLLTNVAHHRAAKSTLTITFLCASIVASVWAFGKDRPIIYPVIGGIITQNYNENWLGMDIEVTVQNSGEQASYAKKWELELEIKGRRFHGLQLYGESLPQGAIKLSELRDQEFPPGKPVSGWLFFAFPDVLHSEFEPYLSCGSLSASSVNVTLSVTDSKEGRKFTQTRNLQDLKKEKCVPMGPPPPKL